MLSCKMADSTTFANNNNNNNEYKDTTVTKKCRTRNRRPDMAVYVARARRSDESEPMVTDSSISRSSSSACTKTPSPLHLSPNINEKQQHNITLKCETLMDLCNDKSTMNVHIDKAPIAGIEKVVIIKNKPPKQQLNCHEGRKKLRQGKRERAMQDGDWRTGVGGQSPQNDKPDKPGRTRASPKKMEPSPKLSPQAPTVKSTGPPCTTRKPPVQPLANKRPSDVIREMMLKQGIHPSPPSSPQPQKGASPPSVNVNDDDNEMLDLLPKSLDEFVVVEQHLHLEKKLSSPKPPVNPISISQGRKEEESRVSPDQNDLEVQLINESFEHKLKQDLLYEGNQLKDLFYGQAAEPKPMSIQPPTVPMSNTTDKFVPLVQCSPGSSTAPPMTYNYNFVDSNTTAMSISNFAEQETPATPIAQDYSQFAGLHNSQIETDEIACGSEKEADIATSSSSSSWAGWSQPKPKRNASAQQSHATNIAQQPKQSPITTQESLSSHFQESSYNSYNSSLESCSALSVKMIEMVLAEDELSFQHDSPKLIKPAPCSSSPPQVTNDDSQAVDSWEDIDEQTLETGILQEIDRKMAEKVRVVVPKIDYLESTGYLLKEPNFYEELTHVLEMTSFPMGCNVDDLEGLLSGIQCQLFSITWVDDNCVLVIFSSTLAANEAMDRARINVNCQFTLRSIQHAAPLSKKKANKCADFLQPVKARPRTTASTARRMVEQHLGKKTDASREQRLQERNILAQAKQHKKERAKNQESAWEGDL